MPVLIFGLIGESMCQLDLVNSIALLFWVDRTKAHCFNSNGKRLWVHRTKAHYINSNGKRTLSSSN